MFRAGQERSDILTEDRLAADGDGVQRGSVSSDLVSGLRFSSCHFFHRGEILMSPSDL
ncbi:MAG: hypothetical protein KJ936_08500 [Proteobacteria bacterium]|nr:hypothetical protein [Pseudomonadota bacterium]MBU2227691.1 hypothetical protein [Pseudomonadota bacterium]MBU2260428.1 hypothetical protein [Pseudomonadota bacterium]